MCLVHSYSSFGSVNAYNPQFRFALFYVFALFRSTGYLKIYIFFVFIAIVRGVWPLECFLFEVVRFFKAQPSSQLTR